MYNLQILILHLLIKYLQKFIYLWNGSLHFLSSSFSSQYLLLFLCVFLPTPFTSVLSPSMHHEEGNFFSEYDRSNWSFYIGCYLDMSSSLLYVQEIIYHFLSQVIFILSILLKHWISKLTKYFSSNFLSSQISKPYNTMLQIKHLTNFFLNSMFGLHPKDDIFLLNTSLALAIFKIIYFFWFSFFTWMCNELFFLDTLNTYDLFIMISTSYVIPV